jgi:hypothetical protein
MPSPLIKSKANCIECGEVFYYEVPHFVWDIETACSQICWDYYYLGEQAVGGVSREHYIAEKVPGTRSP